MPSQAKWCRRIWCRKLLPRAVVNAGQNWATVSGVPSRASRICAVFFVHSFECCGGCICVATWDRLGSSVRILHFVALNVPCPDRGGRLAFGIGAVVTRVPANSVLRKPTQRVSVFGRSDPPGDRVGDGRPQQSPGWAAGAGLPSSASSIFTDSDEI